MSRMTYFLCFPNLDLGPPCPCHKNTMANIFEEMLYCVVRLATPLLNTIKQHATVCNKCCMMFYEMLYSFGRGSYSTLLTSLESILRFLYKTSGPDRRKLIQVGFSYAVRITEIIVRETVMP